MNEEEFEEYCRMGAPFVEENKRRVIFMDHMYKCSGRQDPKHAMHGLYTGLWTEFCLNEAGPVQRNLWFERMQFVQDVKEGKINPDGSVVDPVDEYLECSAECSIDDKECEEECVRELKEAPQVFDSPHQQSITK